MTDTRGNRFEDAVREAVRGYRVAPEPPLDEMWARIERVHFKERGHSRRWPRPWIVAAIGMAAGLFLGMGIGRYVMPTRVWNTAGNETAAAGGPGKSSATSGRQTKSAALSGGPYHAGLYEAVTTEYFGDAAALLRSLPTDTNDGGANRRFVTEGGELLATTRLLLDSPAAGDPELRALLDDLELVLAQIARLSTRRGSMELDLIAGALEQRDVIPRLVSAAAIRYGSSN